MADENNDAIDPDDIIDVDYDIVDSNSEGDSDISTIKESSPINDEESLPQYSEGYGLSSIDKLLETDISDWDYSSARNYVVEFVATANKYKEDYEEKLVELNKWAKRMELAKAHNKNELFEEAVKQYDKHRSDAEYLRNEYMKMEMHADILKKQLREKNSYVPDNDPSILLNKIENILDKSYEDMETEKDLQKLSLEEKLSKLKNKE